MKLCYLANIRMPTEKAHGLQVANMCEAFAEAGAEVTLVVPRRRNPLSDQDPHGYYGVRNNFKIVRLPVIDLVGVIPRLGFWLELATFYISIRRYLSKNSFDIVYTREPVLATRQPKSVLEVHTLPQKLRSVDKRAWDRAEKIVAVTRHLKEQLVRWGTRQEKIIVAHDGVNIERFGKPLDKGEARKRLGLPKDKKIFGYVGMLKTMGMEKGITIALEALRTLPEEYIFLVVGGVADDIDYYRKQADRMGMGGRVIFSGRVPHAQVPEYLKACDVLIAPFPDNRHYRYYMSPLKIFEYMTAGRPIVASDLPSLQEVLNGENSRLIAPANSEELAEKIKWLVENHEQAEQLSAKARKDVEQYTWQERAARIVRFAKWD